MKNYVYYIEDEIYYVHCTTYIVIWFYIHFYFYTVVWAVYVIEFKKIYGMLNNVILIGNMEDFQLFPS